MKRRGLCKTVALGVLGGAIGGSNAASAGEREPRSPAGVDRATPTGYAGTVSTRGHYYVTWYNTVRRAYGVGEYEYEVPDPVPGLDSPASPEELVVFAHGWQVEPSDAAAIFGMTTDTLASNGYDHPVVGFEWDADTSKFHWYQAVLIARRNGKKLAQFLADYRAQNPDTEIRLIGHSLGARVALETVYRLDEFDWRRDGLSLTLLGAAIDDEEVATWERYGPRITRNVEEADNFHSENDEKLLTGYTNTEWDTALGNYGADGLTPDSYQDHEVDYVTNHFHYYREGVGCLDEVVREWTDGRLPPDEGDRNRVTGSIDREDGSRTHEFRVPDDDLDASEIVVVLEGPDGTDFDLYLTLDGRTPTEYDYDRRSMSAESIESISFPPDDVAGRTLGLLVDAYRGTGEYAVEIHGIRAAP